VLEPLIIGAGPAGLSAAWELAQASVPAVLMEEAHTVGGLSRTERYRGFRFDIGGHRFFSRNPAMVACWQDWLGPDLLEVRRLSRILYDGKLLAYPLRPWQALVRLGPWQSLQAVASYAWARAFPRHPVRSFEDWVVNHFGNYLYRAFFQSYTEKVWGMSCRDIGAEWASQRIMGLTLRGALSPRSPRSLRTLADSFYYPRLGPGMMWEALADRLRTRGCELHLGTRVEQVSIQDTEVHVQLRDSDGQYRTVRASHVISTMPLRHLLLTLTPRPPQPVLEAAAALAYRDFLTVALVVDQPALFPDQWLYVHEPNVRVARIQNYKNWSPEMVPDARFTCLGLEYFCFDGDGLWNRSDAELLDLAASELASLGLSSRRHVVDGAVVRVRKAYPVYDTGHPDRQRLLERYLDSLQPRLQVAGRNGMHRYNNQDHAMMTGMLTARNLLGARHNPWRVNSEAQYLEGAEARLVPLQRLAEEPI
jgi:protoporphyrinogen oxidase